MGDSIQVHLSFNPADQFGYLKGKIYPCTACKLLITTIGTYQHAYSGVRLIYWEDITRWREDRQKDIDKKRGVIIYEWQGDADLIFKIFQIPNTR